MARHALGGSLYSYYPAPFLFSDIDWALTLNRASEKLKTLSNNSLSDTFIKFCSVAKTLKVEKEPDGRDSQLRFNNSLYNAAMHKACMAVLSVMSEPGSTKVSAFEAAIHARTMASASRPVDQLAGWLVDMFHLVLNFRLVICARATDIWLDRDRKHQKNGYWHACTSVSEDRGFEIEKFPQAKLASLILMDSL